MEQKYNIINGQTENQSSSLSRENARLREEIKKLFDYVSQTEKNLEATQTKCSSIESEFQRIHSQLNNEKEKSKKYEKILNTNAAEIELHKKTLSEQLQQIENLKTNKESNIQHIKLKANELIAKHQSQIRSQEEQIQNLVREIKHRESLIEDIKKDNEATRLSLINRIQDFATENNKLQLELKKTEENLSSESLTTKSECSRLQNEITHLKLELEESLKQIEVEIAGKLILEKRNTQLDQKNVKLEARLNTLRIELERLQKYEANEHKLRQLAAELEVKNKDLAEIQNALSEQKSLFEKAQSLSKQQVSSLQLQLRSMAQKSSELESNLDLYKRYHLRVKKYVRPLLSTLKEQISNEKRKVQHQLHETTSLKNELDRLTLRLQSDVEQSSRRESDLRNQYNAIVVSYESRLKTMQSQSESTIELLRRQLNDLQSLFDEQKLNGEMRSDKLQDQIRDLLEQKLKTQTQLSETSDYCKTLESEIATLRKQISDNAETHAKLHRQIAQTEYERDQFKSKLTVELDEYAEVTAKLRTINLQRAEEIKRLKDSYAVSERTTRQLEIEKNQLQEQVEGMNTLWQKALTELESKTIDQKQSQKVNRKLVDELRARAEAIQGLKVRNAQLRGEVQKLSIAPRLGDIEFQDSSETHSKTSLKSSLDDFENDDSGEIST